MDYLRSVFGFGGRYVPSEIGISTVLCGTDGTLRVVSGYFLEGFSYEWLEEM